MQAEDEMRSGAAPTRERRGTETQLRIRGFAHSVPHGAGRAAKAAAALALACALSAGLAGCSGCAAGEADASTPSGTMTVSSDLSTWVLKIGRDTETSVPQQVVSVLRAESAILSQGASHTQDESGEQQTAPPAEPEQEEPADDGIPEGVDPEWWASMTEEEREWFLKTGHGLPDGLAPVEGAVIDTPYYTVTLPASWAADARYVYDAAYESSGKTAAGDDLGLGYTTTVVNLETGEQFSVGCFSSAWGPQGSFKVLNLGSPSMDSGMNVFAYTPRPSGDAWDDAVAQATDRLNAYASWVTVK